MKHVFTYGSLMFDRVWSGVVGGDYPAAAATLPGYLRERVRGQDYPSLVHAPSHGAGCPQASVDGVLYLGVNDADLAVLDRFEGSDYRRIPVEVLLREEASVGPAGRFVAGSRLSADTYLFTARAKVEPGPWDPRRFEREWMERFLREYPPPPAPGGRGRG